jgi:hypothetical protein
MASWREGIIFQNTRPLVVSYHAARDHYFTGYVYNSIKILLPRSNVHKLIVKKILRIDKENINEILNISFLFFFYSRLHRRMGRGVGARAPPKFLRLGKK